MRRIVVQKTIKLVEKKSYQLKTRSTNVIGTIDIKGNNLSDYESFAGRKAKIRFIAGEQYLPSPTTFW